MVMRNCFVAAVLTVFIGGLATPQSTPGGAPPDRIQKLIEILKAKGIEFTAEELEALAPPQGTPEGVAMSDARLSAKIEEALEARDQKGGDWTKIRIPGVKSLKISGQNRIRYEYTNNIYTPADPSGRDDGDLIRMRNRLRFDAEVNDNIDVVFELQDVRLWGAEGSTVGILRGVDLKRGAITVKNICDLPVDIEAGRFVMQYGDQRFIGHLEWVDQGRTFDGIRVKAHPEGFFFDAFATRIRETLATGDDQDFYGIYGGTKTEDGVLDVEGYALCLRDQLKRMGEITRGNTLLFTFGARLHGATQGIDYALEAAMQTGEVNDDDVQRAFAVSARAGYTADTSWKPRFGFEFNYATGNDSPGDGDTEQFFTLFPTNHLYYGYADLAALTNIINARAIVSVRPSKTLYVELDYHHFRVVDPDGGWVNVAGATIRPGFTGADRHLGDEVDLIITWRPWKALSLMAGWARFFRGGFVKDTGRGGDNDFIFAQSMVRF